MTTRDRLLVSVLAAAALLAALWFLAVAPKRKDAGNLAISLNAAHVSLASAQQEVAAARVAATSYAQNLQSVRQDYRAVPATEAVAKLLPTLQQASTQRKVDFRVITVATAAAAAAAPPAPVAPPRAGATPAAAAAPAAAPPAASAGFSQTSFTFTFNGGYRLFQSFLHDLDRFVVLGTDGKVHAHNRLLVINSVALKPQNPGHGNTQATITASAYSQPAATSAMPPTAGTGAGPTPAVPAPSNPSTATVHATPTAARQTP